MELCCRFVSGCDDFAAYVDSMARDIVIFQPDMGPAILGTSLQSTRSPQALLAIALVNDCHFWGVLPEVDAPSPYVDVRATT